MPYIFLGTGLNTLNAQIQMWFIKTSMCLSLIAVLELFYLSQLRQLSIIKKNFILTKEIVSSSEINIILGIKSK